MGIEYERHAAAAAKAHADEHARATDPTLEYINDLYEQIQDVSIEERQKRLRKKRPIGEGDHNLDNLVGDLRAWLEKRGSRWIPAPRRIYGQRKAILQAVAAAASSNSVSRSHRASSKPATRSTGATSRGATWKLDFWAYLGGVIREGARRRP
jgi:hypothetical protein